MFRSVFFSSCARNNRARNSSKTSQGGESGGDLKEKLREDFPKASEETLNEFCKQIIDLGRLLDPYNPNKGLKEAINFFSGVKKEVKGTLKESKAPEKEKNDFLRNVIINASILKKLHLEKSVEEIIKSLRGTMDDAKTLKELYPNVPSEVVDRFVRQLATKIHVPNRCFYFFSGHGKDLYENFCTFVKSLEELVESLTTIGVSEQGIKEEIKKLLDLIIDNDVFKGTAKKVLEALDMEQVKKLEEFFKEFSLRFKQEFVEYTKNKATQQAGVFEKFLLCLSRAWFKTQPNPHINTLIILDNGEKIFLFVSGPVPFTSNEALGKLKEIIDLCKNLFNKTMSSKKTVEIIDIHSLLTETYPQAFIDFIQFLFDIKDIKDKDFEKCIEKIHNDTPLGNIKKAIIAAYQRLKINNIEKDLYDTKGNFNSETDRKALEGINEKLLEILYVCQISSSFVVDIGGSEDNENEMVLANIMDKKKRVNLWVKFCEAKQRGEISDKEYITGLCNNIDAKTLLSKKKLLSDDSEEFSNIKKGFLPNDIAEFTHTEKFALIILECLKILRKVENELIKIKNYIDKSKNKECLKIPEEVEDEPIKIKNCIDENEDKEFDKSIENLFSILKSKKDKKELGVIEGSLYDIVEKFHTLKEKDVKEKDVKEKGVKDLALKNKDFYKKCIISKVNFILNACNKFKSFKDALSKGSKINVYSCLPMCKTCKLCINSSQRNKDLTKDCSIYHLIKSTSESK